VARVASASWLSWGRALSTYRPIGRPLPSATTITLLPLPPFVVPTPSPPFWQARNYHPETPAPTQACSGPPAGAAARATSAPRCLLGLDAEAPPAGRRRSVHAGHILPRTAGLQHDEEAIEGLAIDVPFPAGAGFLLRDQGLDDSPLFNSDLVAAHAHS
jgi:hypothetical protein